MKVYVLGYQQKDKDKVQPPKRSRSGNAMVDGLIGLWVGYFAIFAA
jgi:hypothetical protein